MITLDNIIAALAFDRAGGGEQIIVEELSVDTNAVYIAPEGYAYSPVTVNVTTPLSDYLHTFSGSGISAINPNDIMAAFTTTVAGRFGCAANIGGQTMFGTAPIMISKNNGTLTINGGFGNQTNGSFLTFTGTENDTGLTCTDWTVFQNGVAQDLTAYASILITSAEIKFYA